MEVLVPFIGVSLPSSTALQGATYDEERGLLIVRFIQGQTYMYSDVYPDEIEDLISAASVGSEFYYGIREEKTYFKL
jgi:hypothetical protein